MPERKGCARPHHTETIALQRAHWQGLNKKAMFRCCVSSRHRPREKDISIRQAQEWKKSCRYQSGKRCRTEDQGGGTTKQSQSKFSFILNWFYCYIQHGRENHWKNNQHLFEIWSLKLIEKCLIIDLLKPSKNSYYLICCI